MHRQALPHHLLREAVAAWRDAGSIEGGARALGMAKSAFRRRLEAATREKIQLDDGTVSPVAYVTQRQRKEPGWWLRPVEIEVERIQGSPLGGGVPPPQAIVRHEPSSAANGQASEADMSAEPVDDGPFGGHETSEAHCKSCGALSDRERVGMRDRIKRLERELEAIHRENIEADEVRREIFGLAADDIRPPRWLHEAPDDPRSPGIPTLMLSDLHWGEVVASEEMRGLNEYGRDIAADRLRKVIGSTVDLCFTHTAAADYPGIVVALGGDMVSGGIHEELADTDDLPPIPASLDLAEQLIAGLTLLAEAFGRVFVPCVDGNHDRDGKNIRFKGRKHHSFGWLIYQMLDRHFANDERVQFLISNENDALYELAGRRYLLTHGDQIGARGGDGIIGALGPIRRGSFKVSNQYAAFGQSPDTIIMGHWHQAIGLRDIIVNNSLKGWDEYARQKLRAPYSTPSQVLWWTHPVYGISRFEEVFAERPKDAREVAEWVKWEEA